MTAADLYGPHWFFRVHVVAESMLAAGFIHLALVFPTDRLGGRRGRALARRLRGRSRSWRPSISGRWRRRRPTRRCTSIASASHGLGALAIIGVVAYDLATTGRRWCAGGSASSRLGTLGAFALPGGAHGGVRGARRARAAERGRIHGVRLPAEPRLRDRQAGPLRDRRHAAARGDVCGRVDGDHGDLSRGAGAGRRAGAVAEPLAGHDGGLEPRDPAA